MSEHRWTYQDADGVRRTLITDDERPDDVVVHTEQALDEILASVERDREAPNDGVNKLLARIPVEVYERAVIQQWDEADWARWLNSSEAAPFRIWRGKV
ncbi:MAG TPA: hypothetical protein VGG68_15610 [Caulobacteraceae bacterium]